MITTGQQGLLVSSRMRHFFVFVNTLLNLIVGYLPHWCFWCWWRIETFWPAERWDILTSPLCPPISLSQGCSNKLNIPSWKKRTPSMISKPRSTMHPSLKTSMVFREQQLLMKGINDNTKGKYFSFMELQMFLFFCSEKIPLKASFVFLVIVPYIRYVNIFFCWCI